MNKIYRLLFPVLLLAAITGCKKDEEEATEPKLDFFAFQSTSATVTEGGEVEISVFWSKTREIAGTVELEVYNWGAPYKAIEDTEGDGTGDFTLSTHKLEFAANEYVKTFTVEAYQNGEWHNNRGFIIELGSTDTESALGESGKENSTVRVTIMDDDDAVFGGGFSISGEQTNGSPVTLSSPLSPDTEKGRGFFTANSNISLTVDGETILLEMTVIIDNTTSSSDVKEAELEKYKATIELPQVLKVVGEGDNIRTYMWAPASYDDVSKEFTYIDSFHTLTAYCAYDDIKFEFGGDTGMILGYKNAAGEFVIPVNMDPFCMVPGTISFSKN